MSTELDLLRLVREAKKGATKIKTRINRVVVDLNPKANSGYDRSGVGSRKRMAGRGRSAA